MSKVKNIIAILVSCLLFGMIIFWLSTKNLWSENLVANIFSLIFLVATIVLIFLSSKDKWKFNFNFLENRKYEILAISLILLFAILIRAVNLSNIPDGMMGDEWSMLYESWSIAHYGIDRNGNSLPVYLVAWGSGQNALLTYLTIPFVLIFGMTPFSARIVMMISSVVTVIMGYLLTKELTDKKTALIVMICLAFMPWNFMLGRWGLESNLLPCLLTCGVYFLVKSLKGNSWWFVLANLFFGLSLYSYALDFVFLPLFLISIYVVLFIKKKIEWKSFIVGNVLLFILAFPLILFVLVNYTSLPEFKLFNIFTVPKLAGLRPGANGSFSFIENIKNFIRFFLFQNDWLPWNDISPFGYSFFISIPFLIIGMINMFINIKKDYINNNFRLLMTIWLICGLLSCFIMSSSSLNHFNMLMVPYFYSLANGIVVSSNNSRVFYSSILCMYSVLFTMFSCIYFSDNRQAMLHDMYSQDLYEATIFAESIKHEQDTIIVDDGGYMITLCANKMSPIEFSESVVWVGTGIRGVSEYKGYKFTNEYLGDDGYVYILKKDSNAINDVNNLSHKEFGKYSVYYAMES